MQNRLPHRGLGLGTIGFALAAFVLTVLKLDAQTPIFSAKEFPPGARIPIMGQGYDAYTGEVKPTVCVDPQTSAAGVQPPFFPGGQESVATLTNVQSSDSLRTALNLDVAATFKLGLYGSGSASYNYFASSSFSRYANYFAISVVVTNQTESAGTRLKLSSTGLDAWNKGPLSFYDTCGTEFVAGKTTGGEFNAVVDVQSNSEAEQKQTSASLTAAVGQFATTDIRFKTNMETDASLNRTQVTVMRRGGVGDLSFDVAGLTQYAVGFPKQVEPCAKGQVNCQSHEYVIRIQTAGYRGLLPTYSLGTEQWRALNELASAIGRFYGRRAGLTYIKANLGLFPQMGSARVQNEIDMTETAIKTVQYAAEGCATNLMYCRFNKYPRIPELPIRATWTNIPSDAAKKKGWQILAVTEPGDKRILQLAGSWSPYEPGHDPNGDVWYGTNSNMHVLFTNRGGGPPIETIVPNYGPVTVPENSVVSIAFFDSLYTDNRINPSDPIRWILYEPFEEFDLGDVAPQSPLHQLKLKYKSVLTLLDQEGAQLLNLHMVAGKLYLKALTRSPMSKNKIWTQIKAVDSKYSDLSADLSVSNVH